MKFTDIHSHIAWCVDDGMPSKEDAVKSLIKAKEDGVETIVATPHVIPGQTDEKEFEQINRRIDELAALAAGADIKIIRGCEFFMNDLTLQWLERGLCNRIGESDYVLMEFNPRINVEKITYADDIIYEIVIRGIKPVLAHVERYFDRIDTDRVRKWIAMGCKVQVNRTSILGMHGSINQKNSRILLEEGLCHAVATDTHRAGGERIGVMSDAFSAVEAIAGRPNAELLLSENPNRIIANKELQDMTVTKKKKSLLSRLKGKR